MSVDPITFFQGIPETHRIQTAELIEEAFEAKMRFAIPGYAERLRVLSEGLCLQSAIGSFERDTLVGVLGLKSTSSSVFDGITFAMLRKELGLGAIRAAIVLHLLDRSVPEGTVHIEFIAVAGSMRGRGIGTGLLAAAAEFVCAHRAVRLELDVVDSNAEAHRLYQRVGFQDVRTESLPIPKRWMGFTASTRMRMQVMCAEAKPPVQ